MKNLFPVRIAAMYYISKMLDLAITQVGLSRGFVEVNPLMRPAIIAEPFKILMIIYGTTLFVYFATKYVRHPLIADLARLVVIFSFVASFYNLALILFL